VTTTRAITSGLWNVARSRCDSIVMTGVEGPCRASARPRVVEYAYG
jgi:hypothetical protein